MVFRESVEDEIWLGEGVCGHLSRNVRLYKSSRIRQCLISYDDTTPLDLIVTMLELYHEVVGFSSGMLTGAG